MRNEYEARYTNFRILMELVNLHQTQDELVLACVACCMPLGCVGGCVGLCMCLCLDKMGHSQHHDAHVHMLSVADMY